MTRLPPCGGSGLKYIWTVSALEQSQSPSMRREWIEIRKYHSAHMRWPCLPPCGGSGLKCKIVARQQVQEGLPPCGGSGLKCYGYIISHISERLPPCGGSGLKFCMIFLFLVLVKSPSMRREWIEITSIACSVYLLYGLPPCGGSGLKFFFQIIPKKIRSSPSMRREWIEIPGT